MTNVLSFKEHKPAVELSNDKLISLAPSIGATAPISNVSDKYSFVSTIDAINLIRDAGWTPIEARQGKVIKNSVDGFQRHMVKFTKPELDMGDRRLEMNLYNSHDKASSFILTGGIYVLVCSNGLVVGSDTAEYRHRHIGFDNDKFVESARFVAERMTGIGDVLLDWEKIQLDKKEAEIFAFAAHEILNEGKSHVGTKALDLLESRRRENDDDNLWNVYNRIQENVIRGGLSSVSARGRQGRTRAITNIKRDKQLNQGLWDMASHIHKVKLAA